MADFKLSAPTIEAFAIAAQSIGFWHNGAIVTHGDLPDKSGTWDLSQPQSYSWPSATETETDSFGNVVPKTVTDGNVWAGLRLSGNNPFQLGLLPIPTGLTIYALVTTPEGKSYWSADGGVTPAPEYVANIASFA